MLHGERLKLDEMMKLVDSNNNFPGFHFQMSLFSLKKSGKIFGRLFQLIMDGRFRFEFVLASVSFQCQLEHQLLGSPDCPTEEHSEEASSLIRQLLTPDLCERLKSAVEVKVRTMWEQSDRFFVAQLN